MPRHTYRRCSPGKNKKRPKSWHRGAGEVRRWIRAMARWPKEVIRT
jgi:hypothetical protein